MTGLQAKCLSDRGYNKSGGCGATGGFSASTEKIEKLYFNCGQGRFIRVLTFRGGILVLIEIGERGSGEQRCW